MMKKSLQAIIVPVFPFIKLIVQCRSSNFLYLNKKQRRYYGFLKESIINCQYKKSYPMQYKYGAIAIF